MNTKDKKILQNSQELISRIMKEQQFPVWTPEGVMHLKRMLRLIH